MHCLILDGASFNKQNINMYISYIITLHDKYINCGEKLLIPTFKDKTNLNIVANSGYFPGNKGTEHPDA